MDLRDVMANQITQSDLENKHQDEESKLAKLEKDQKNEQEKKAKERIGAIKFAILKNKMESSPLRDILETLAQELNSQNPRFALLKAKIIEMVRLNPNSQIKDNPIFSVSKPYGYEGVEYLAYYIDFFIIGDQNLKRNTIFSVSYTGETDHFGLHINRYLRDLRFIFYNISRDIMAKKIIDSLMTM
jgi:hypothetical protein